MNEDLKEFANILFAPRERDDLKQRIDKAIEILEIEKKSQELTNNGFCACSICHALDILKGSDKE